jgi:hypothetical protein
MVGVVPPLWVTLEGLGEDGGSDWCLAIMAIFLRRVVRRVRIMLTTLFEVSLGHVKKIPGLKLTFMH